jgi:DNA-binding MarR family transcriptional regulator
MTPKSDSPQPQTPAGRLDAALLSTVLGYQLAQAAIVTDGIFEAQVGDPLQLRRIQYTVLTLIAENPGSSPARIARALAVTPPHITAAVDHLAQRGLVKRKANTQDRRGQALAVTRQGAELVRQATQGIVAAERVAMALTPGEAAILAELLHKVAGARDGGH